MVSKEFSFILVSIAKIAIWRSCLSEEKKNILTDVAKSTNGIGDKGESLKRQSQCSKRGTEMANRDNTCHNTCDKTCKQAKVHEPNVVAV